MPLKEHDVLVSGTSRAEYWALAGLGQQPSDHQHCVMYPSLVFRYLNFLRENKRNLDQM